MIHSNFPGLNLYFSEKDERLEIKMEFIRLEILENGGVILVFQVGMAQYVWF